MVYNDVLVFVFDMVGLLYGCLIVWMCKGDMIWVVVDRVVVIKSNVVVGEEFVGYGVMG